MADYSDYYAGKWGGLSNLTPRDLKLFVPESVGRLIDDDDTTIQDLIDENAVPEERTTIDKLCLGFLCVCKQVTQADKNDPSIEVEYQYQMLESYEHLSYWLANSDPTYEYVKSWTVEIQDYCLSLFPLKNRQASGYIENLYKEFYADSTEINTAVLYALQFVANGIFDALQPFLIKNQNFACKQIKYTITARGFEKIAEGEFYKL